MLIRLTLIGFMLCAWIGSNAHADTLAGTNYFAINIGTVDYDFDFDDFEANLDSGTILEAYGNFNYMHQIDVIAGLSKGWTDGRRNRVNYDFDVTEISGGGRFFFKPGTKFNPYAGGGLQLISWEWEARHVDSDFKATDDDTEIGIYVEGGY